MWSGRGFRNERNKRKKRQQNENEVRFNRENPMFLSIAIVRIKLGYLNEMNFLIFWLAV